jgi:signal transduction histidine kinase
LHDDVLPQLHTVLLGLTSSPSTAGHALDETDATSETVAMLTSVHRQISDMLRDAPTSTPPDVARLGPLRALRQTVEDELGAAFDEVSWQIQPEAEHESISLPTVTGEVLFYAAREVIRNAARHGRPAGEASRTALHLRVGASGSQADGLEMVIEDDGVGLEPGERPTAGNGRGLALHSTMMAIVGGSLTVDSARGEYTRVRLTVPGTSSSSSLLASASALPGSSGPADRARKYR